MRDCVMLDALSGSGTSAFEPKRQAEILELDFVTLTRDFVHDMI